jgi:hypothetical protein
MPSSSPPLSSIWLEQTCLEKLIERLTGNNFYNTPEHIDRVTVVPDLARLMSKWERGQFGNDVGKSPVAVKDAGFIVEVLVVQLVHLRLTDTMNHPGGMAQQILDDHRTLLRLVCDVGLAGRRVPGLDSNCRSLELWKILGDRGCEIELALLNQHHGGHTGDRLGHRGDPEDRIALKRDRLCAVAKANGLQISDLAVPRDGRDRAREGAGINLRLLPGRDPRQPRRREAKRFRIAHRRDVVRARGGGKADSCKADSCDIEDRQCRETAMQALHPGVPFQFGESDGREALRHRAIWKAVTGAKFRYNP